MKNASAKNKRESFIIFVNVPKSTSMAINRPVRCFYFSKKLPPYIPWRYSISRPIAPTSSVVGGDDTIRPGQSDVYFRVLK
jgi:hypothetical protein